MDWLDFSILIWVYFTILGVFVIFGMWKLANVDRAPRPDPSKQWEPDVNQGKANLTKNIEGGGFNH